MATTRAPAPGRDSLLTPDYVPPGMLSKTLLREFPRTPSCWYIIPGLVRQGAAPAQSCPHHSVAGLAGICLLLE